MTIRKHLSAICLSLLCTTSVWAQSINGSATLKLVPTSSSGVQSCDHFVVDTSKIQLSLSGLSGSVQIPEENISVHGKFVDQVAQYERVMKRLQKVAKHRKAPASGPMFETPEPLLIFTKSLSGPSRRGNMELLSVSINKTDGVSVSLNYQKLQRRKSICFRNFTGKLVR